jgi:hypothetical protein
VISVRIKDSNTVFGAPESWDNRNGECANLFVRKQQQDGVDVMLSAWKPTKLELEMLQDGASIVLGVLGSGHPPVLMYVSDEE